MQIDKISRNMMMSSEKFQKEKEYWLNKLEGDVVISGFPADHQRLSLNEFEKACAKFKFDKEVSQKLIAMSRKSEFGLYMLLLSGVKCLLYKYTRNENLLVGMPVFKQSNTDANFINNVLAIKTQVKGNLTLKELLTDIKDIVSEANLNQNFPFSKIAELLKLQEDADSFPLLNIIVLLENIHDKSYIESIKADTVFGFSMSNETIEGSIEYNSKLFESRTIEQIATHIVNFFSSITKNPNVKLSEINVLSQEEKDRILYSFNDTDTEYPKNKTICQLFEERVENNPDSIAVVFGDKQLTYKELNSKANCLARLLKEKGVKPDDIVGLMVGRSLEIIIGMMAILKAGGAYLPIDPEYPEHRIKYMLEDSNANILLTQSYLKDKIKYKSEFINIEDKELYNGDDSNLEKSNTPDNLAYVIYTSGSTGNPKGVMLEHRAVNNFIYGITDRIHFSEGQAILSVTTISFDIFVLETLLPLVNGLRIVIASENEQRDSKALSRLIVEKNAEVIQTTPSRMQLLVSSQEGAECLQKLKIIMVGGEALPKTLLENLKNKSSARIYNMYGPTETTVWSTVQEMTHANDVDIGKPISNTQVYIVDTDFNMQPVGVAGELCIGGDGLARGYLNRRELTDEKFVNNSFIPDRKMYRTGDLAMWLPDGNIKYLGRMDFQVKIRGFRIELGEIESRLLNYESVIEAAVAAREEESGDKYLCAYYVSEKELTVQELRKHLSKEMPEYMIPSYFVRMESLPKTPNGKVDKKSLPEPDKNITTGVVYIAPRNDIEERIAEVWQEVLGIERIGINNNFFEMGGDSLKAIQAATKLLLEYEFIMEDVFEYQTISSFAGRISIKVDSLKEYISQLKKLEYFIEEPDSYGEEIESKIEDYNKMNKKYDNVDVLEKENYRSILLTGSTGYLGIHILRELLKGTDYDVYLLIRSDNPSEAQKRIIQKLEFYFEENLYQQYDKRILVLSGDLTKDKFGLSQEEYTVLADKIDCIINPAANVSHYGRYDELYEVNVKGVERLINFAKIGKRKDFNQISSISVGTEGMENDGYNLFVEYDDALDRKFNNIYLETKLGSEKLICEARKDGVKANIMRMGRLVFNSESGKCLSNIEGNAFTIFTKALIKIGLCPEINRKTNDFTFVDYAGRSIVALFDKKNLKNETYHVGNPYGVSATEMANFLNSAGVDVKMCSYREFVDFLYNNIDNSNLKTYIMNALLHFNAFKVSDLRFNDKTSVILERMGIKWTELRSDHIKKMVDYFKKVNYI